MSNYLIIYVFRFLKCILEMQLEKQNDTSFLGQLQILFSLMHFSEVD